MKTFIATVTYKKASYAQTAHIKIYRVKKNNPVYLGETSFNTGSCKGNESEVFTWLFHNKEVSENIYRNYEGYYRWYEGEEMGINITVLEA